MATNLLDSETFWLKSSVEDTVEIAGLWPTMSWASAVWTRCQELSLVTVTTWKCRQSI